MATATPLISEANLTRSGGSFAAAISKKPVYAVRDLSAKPSAAVHFREGRPARQPKHLLLGTLSHPRLRMLRAIPVDLSRRHGQFLARFNAADEFGSGMTMSAALEDLGKTIAELFIGLSEKQEVLGPDLLALHAKLSRYLAYR